MSSTPFAKEVANPEPTARQTVAGCPACGAVDVWRLARIPEATIRSCRSCGLVFCDPLPAVVAESSGEVSILTEQRYTETLVARAAARKPAYARLAQQRYEHFAGALQQPRFRMLEIGCGVAGLAPELVRLGVDYHGIDIDPRVCRVGIDRGVGNVRNVDLMRYETEREFDVVSFSQVLEHITAPRAFIARVWSLLRSGGILHLDVPNHFSLSGLLHMLLRRPRTRFGGIDYPHHALAYSARALRRLLEPQFEVSIFSANPDHPLWGQVDGERMSFVHRQFFRAADRLGRRSLLVAYGRKPTSLGVGAFPSAQNSSPANSARTKSAAGRT
jgi:SAM-dependent methyltransferase